MSNSEENAERISVLLRRMANYEPGSQIAEAAECEFLRRTQKTGAEKTVSSLPFCSP